MTHLQIGLQKSAAKEEQGPVCPEVQADELCWHRAHRETERWPAALQDSDKIGRILIESSIINQRSD